MGAFSKREEAVLKLTNHLVSSSLHHMEPGPASEYTKSNYWIFNDEGSDVEEPKPPAAKPPAEKKESLVAVKEERREKKESIEAEKSRKPP